VHTEYSLLDGLSRLEDLINKTKELGMDSIAITDHGVLYGAINFYRLAKKAGIKPIIGCEMYVAPGSRLNKNPSEKTPFHLTVLAKNSVGYKNLVKLVTLSHLEGFYYRPRIDRELMEKHSEGLIVLSGCPSGEIPTLIKQGNLDKAAEAALWYRNVFGDYFLEVMQHEGVEDLDLINNGLLELHNKFDLPLVATNDLHYVEQSDFKLQDIMICIHTNTNIQDDKRLKMEDKSYYVKSPSEMEELFVDFPDAISNTQAIAEMCDLEIDFSGLHLPEFVPPDDMDSFSFLKKLCVERLGNIIQNYGDKETERLEYELSVIRETNYADYFLVVWDIAEFVRANNIAFAVRGSAAASLVLYLLGVTDINPLDYRLVFERFLNVERKEMPDIDMDFQDDRRSEVLDYVVSKYGHEHVAQIITFGTLGARAAVRDVGRALAMPYSDVDRIARMIPTRLKVTLREALLESEELRGAVDNDSDISELIQIAQDLEGSIRHSSTHAAGVVISQKPIGTILPLQRATKNVESGIPTTQYEMDSVAALGLLKLDFLGLSNLSVMANVRDLVFKTKGVELNLREMPPRIQDDKTFEMLSEGKTVGVFQLEGSGMTRYITELKPDSLGDIAAMIALFRPGPMDHISTFIEGRHGRIIPEYAHPAIKDILEETYGVIVYQDQVLLLVQSFAGYSLGEADIVRKAMGKKVPEIMAQERKKFVDGSISKGHSLELAEQIFDLIEPFAGYAFNKSHSVSYALISYWTAYLKANYTGEYMACLLNAYIDNTDKLVSSINECKRLNILVLGPDINFSDIGFSVSFDDQGASKIRFGLSSIKNIGSAAVLPILEARKRIGTFESIEQLCTEADLGSVNRKTLESLIKSGAFDSFGSRAGLFEIIDRILVLANSEGKMKNSQQSSMFESFGDTVNASLAEIKIPDLVTPDKQRSEWEFELLGLDLSNSYVLYELDRSTLVDTVMSESEITSSKSGKKINLVGQIQNISNRFTKDSRPYLLVSLALFEGSIDVFVWNEILEKTQGLWEIGTLIKMNCSVRSTGDRVSLSCVAASKYSAEDKIDNESNLVVKTIENNSSFPTDNSSNGVGKDGLDVVDVDNFSNGVEKDELNVIDVDNSSNGVDNFNNGVENLTDGMNQVVETNINNGFNKLILEIQDDGVQDNAFEFIDNVAQVLLEHRGNVQVGLRVLFDGTVIHLDWPQITVDLSDQLVEKLNLLMDGKGKVDIKNS